MPTEIVVPELSESVHEATIARWLKKVGDSLKAGDVIVELETDKVNVEVAVDESGVLSRVNYPEGADVKVGDVLAVLESAESIPAPSVSQTEAAPQVPTASPIAKRVADEAKVDLSRVQGTGTRGKITREDVQRVIDGKKPAEPPRPTESPAVIFEPARSVREERIKMSRRRRTIAARLVEAQQTAAMLTTFNEIDMNAVQEIRGRRKEAFKEKYGVSLGLSSFFVKAVVGALKAFPRLNAEIQGDEIVLKRYYDIGIAIGDEEGLVVPVLRDADRMSFAEIEKNIKAYAQQVRDGSLPLEAIKGGTFTITNGGIFGSMMSTPILNPPQVGILGLHNIVDRPVVVNHEIVIRPIMYVALTYDHRIVDGRESVQFLVRVKQLMEDPESLLIEG
ncbi:MAG: 2-oxoglutarate dehydrogenase complex dihydrolipoyllysine-residue succinyltransferase [Anaerolineae bacterium]|nr:2-oxoglutarate dehydrogenase complex dihydrolipoyllysine-residue succinyltransferase [Anaerolineae bacterium]